MNPSYLAGFIDGDGSIYVDQQKRGYSLQIKISQCNLDILKIIHKAYGGKLYEAKVMRPGKNGRLEHALRICGKDTIPILNDIENTVIMKNEQVQLAKQFIQYIGKPNTGEYKKQICEKLKSEYVQRTNQKYDRLNLAYIAGLFDAEGCVFCSWRPPTIFGYYIKITQKSDLHILNLINQFFNENARIDRSNAGLTFTGKERIEKILTDILPFLIVKKLQAELMILFVNSNTLEDKIELSELIKSDKH